MQHVPSHVHILFSKKINKDKENSRLLGPKIVSGLSGHLHNENKVSYQTVIDFFVKSILPDLQTKRNGIKSPKFRISHINLLLHGHGIHAGQDLHCCLISLQKCCLLAFWQSFYRHFCYKKKLSADSNIIIWIKFCIKIWLTAHLDTQFACFISIGLMLSWRGGLHFDTRLITFVQEPHQDCSRWSYSLFPKVYLPHPEPKFVCEASTCQRSYFGFWRHFVWHYHSLVFTNYAE